MDIVQRIAMKVVILNDEGEALILREAGNSYQEGTNEGKWGLPGGRVKPGENWLDGLNREVLEETGLNVTYQEPIYIGEWRPVIKGRETQIIAVFNLCRYKNGKIKLSEEHDSFAWVSLADLKEYQLVEPDNEVARMAILKG